MGPGPINADPRVLRAMSMPLLGQFDPEFTAYMNETMVLLRRLYQTSNRWSLLVDGTARAGIEAILVSLIEPGDRVLVPIFGRFGHLLSEIAARCGAELSTMETEWGTVFEPDAVEAEVKRVRPKLVAIVHGDTSTTMAQPLAEIGDICRRYDCILYVDATATLGGMDFPVDAWKIDAASAGLQKCLSGPPGSAPITFNERVERLVKRRKHVEAGIRPAGFVPPNGPRIRSNYFDLAHADGLLGRGPPQPPHRGRLHALRGARVRPHRAARRARRDLRPARPRQRGAHRRPRGDGAQGVRRPRHKMANVTGVYIPDGIDGDKVRAALLNDFGIEIGTSFGPLHGRIWRIGTMGYNCRKQNVLICLGALEAVLRRAGSPPAGAAVEAAYGVYAGAAASV